jgi:hypothetical protein
LEPDEGAGEFLRFNPMNMKKADLMSAMSAVTVVDIDVHIRWIVENIEGNEETLETTVTVKMDEEEQAAKGKPGHHPNLVELRVACLRYLVDNSQRTLMNDLEFGLARAGSFIALFNAPYFSWGMLIEMVWSQSKGFWMYTSNEGGKFDEMAAAMRDGMYTDNYASPEDCKVRGGNSVKDAATQQCASTQALLRHMLYGAKKTIRVQIECDAVLRGGGNEPYTFDNLIIADAEVLFATGPITRFASDYKLKNYLEAEGEEDLEEAAQDLDEDSEVEDDD